jgi:hypothetical protein
MDVSIFIDDWQLDVGPAHDIKAHRPTLTALQTSERGISSREHHLTVRHGRVDLSQRRRLSAGC